MIDSTARKFVAAGAILFLLGLLTGFAIPNFLNPRMGLASHLEGVMNGTFLIALGAAWSHVKLNHRLEITTFWLLIYGTFVNWLSVLIAAVFATSEITPIAGYGYSGTALQEQIVTIGLLSVGFAMVVGCIILVFGLVNRKNA